MGHQPIQCLSDFKKYNIVIERNSVSDSLYYLTFHDNYVKSWSPEYMIAKLLTQAF
jgi:hypothetical protein